MKAHDQPPSIPPPPVEQTGHDVNDPLLAEQLNPHFQPAAGGP
jgi:hypothetical protein